jgi:DUF2970 family protein
MVFNSISDSVLILKHHLPYMYCSIYRRGIAMKPKNQPTGAHDEEPVPHVSLLQMVGSILASFYGVQSSKNRHRDFKSGKAGAFIAVGILMTVVWYLLIYLVVTLVLHIAR